MNTYVGTQLECLHILVSNQLRGYIYCLSKMCTCIQLDIWFWNDLDAFYIEPMRANSNLGKFRNGLQKGFNASHAWCFTWSLRTAWAMALNDQRPKPIMKAGGCTAAMHWKSVKLRRQMLINVGHSCLNRPGIPGCMVNSVPGTTNASRERCLAGGSMTNLLADQVTLFRVLHPYISAFT